MEWIAFKEATPAEINLVRVTNTKTKPLDLLKSEGTYPIIWSNSFVFNEKSAFLWTVGNAPKTESTLSLSVSNPIYIEINKSEADI